MKAAEAMEYIVDSVISKDGTAIGYRRYGRGPAIVLVNGAIGTTTDYDELARALAPAFTVYVPERRGRPLSPSAYNADRVLKKEIDDVRAVCERSGARVLFGLSSGAVIALEAALTLPCVDKLVLFEGPLHVPPHALRLDLVNRFYRELDAGKVVAAMVTALLISEMLPRALNLLPRVILEAAASVALLLDDRKEAGTTPPLREIVPSMRFDFGVVKVAQNRFDVLAAVTADVLLLNCKRSPVYIQDSATALMKSLPKARRVEFDTLTHAGPWNANRGGQPQVVAAEIERFIHTTSDLMEAPR